jgi:hypothetical protein
LTGDIDMSGVDGVDGEGDGDAIDVTVGVPTWGRCYHYF